MGGLTGALLTGLIDENEWKEDIPATFSLMHEQNRSTWEQALFQLATLGSTVVIAGLSGAVMGLLLKIPCIWAQPTTLYDDSEYWCEAHELVHHREGEDEESHSVKSVDEDVKQRSNVVVPEGAVTHTDRNQTEDQMLPPIHRTHG